MSLEDLSKSAILRRILNTVERVELMVSAASDYMVEALSGLDSQMEGLKARLQADAEALQNALSQLDLAEEDSAALVAAADRVNATAQAVSQLAQPSAVADPDQPDVTAEPLPEGETTDTTGGTGGTGEQTPADPTSPDYVAPGTDGQEGVDARPGDATAPAEQQTGVPPEEVEGGGEPVQFQ